LIVALANPDVGHDEPLAFLSYRQIQLL